MVSEAKRRNNDAYNAKCVPMQIRPRKEDAERIRAAIAASGQSMQAYFLQAIFERMEREKAEG